MGRPKKNAVKGTEANVAAAETPVNVDVREKTKEDTLKDSDILLVKTVNKNVAARLIEGKANVKHISGTGQTINPKVWFIEASVSLLNKLTDEEQGEVKETTYKEIQERIGKSIVVKEQERKESNAQKRKAGEAPTPRLVSDASEI